MKRYTISQLAHSFGLSRSTLLFYDKIGLLSATERTNAGYRRYTEQDYRKLERICIFRSAGLSLADVKKILSDNPVPTVAILEKRLMDLNEEILGLRSQQHLITAMLKNMTGKQVAPTIDKKMWVEMLASAGMNEEDMRTWHAEFERRAPQAHYDFLLSLGIPEKEARYIQEWSLEAK